MYELSCPTCNSPSQYDLRDYLLMCPFCSATFRFDHEHGQKDVYGDHYIIPNSSSTAHVKMVVLEWLKRLHHKPGQVESEFFVTDIKGMNIPFWIVSMEVHSSWKGMVQRSQRSRLDHSPGKDFIVERGEFRRSYRWAISARENICETWGLNRLHEPKENMRVDWDGFPLDSTLSRGLLVESKNSHRNPYESREFFDFKYANGLPILGIQISDNEGLRRAKSHVDQYHLKLAKTGVDYLTDYRSEFEIAGVQLVHLPFWHANYVYRPRKAGLRHLHKPKEKNVVVDGYANGVLKAELAIQNQDKVKINSIVTAIFAIVSIVLGMIWHPAFFLIALFSIMISIGTYIVASNREANRQILSEEDPEEPQLATEAG